MEVGQIIGLMLLLCSATHFLVLVAFLLYFVDEKWPVLYTPTTFYKLTNMNWFGCIIVYILLFPFAFVFEVGGFLKWLFTIGRK